MKKITTLLLFIGCFATMSFAQSAKLKRANMLFEEFAFQPAIELYLEVLEKADVSEAKINLAECYRKVNNMGEAEFWYGQVVHLPEAKPIHYLYYGKALQANGKCDLAKPWFEKYSREVPDDLRGQLLANTCNREELEKMIASRKDFYEINKLPFNTSYDDFGPAFYKNGFIFASERSSGGLVTREHEWTGYPFLDLFYVKADTVDAEALTFKYSEPEKFDRILNTKFHDGPACFTKDGKKIFFTRNNLDERNRTGKDEAGTVRLKIYYSTLEDDKWQNFTSLPFNSDEYSVAHPAYDENKKILYFASDMPGGFGGMDLYYSTLEDGGNWSPPRNLGPRINTEGHEVFPYFHPSGRLYFSSDGHVGMGMLDVYYLDNQDGVWSPPMNVGFPINTPSDDFGMILNNEETFGYFSSNRDGGVGRDDIYSFKYSVVKVEVLVYDENTNEPIDAVSIIDDCSGLELFTGSNGRVMIELPLNKCCTFLASKDTYVDNSLESCTHDYKASTKVFVKIPLSQPMDFVIEGIVYDESTKEPLANSKVVLMPNCGGDVVEFETDASGRYRFVLGKDCCYSLKAEHEGYFAVSTDKPYCTKGLRKSQTFVHDFPLQKYVDNPPGISEETSTNNPCGGIARTFVIEHIYYDFDKAYIRDDAQAPLSQLIKILTDNPDLVVEIGSHTDARGSDRYNVKLSARRATSVVKYLIGQGIGEERLQAKGYGESQTTNDCVDEVPCTEEQHQRNRRTEFRVIGKIDGTRYDCETDGVVDINQTSIEPIVLKVDKCANCPF